MTDTIRIHNEDLTVTVAEVGAQLTSIRDAAGAEWLWPGDPAIWPRQAPTLFPVVAQVHGGEVRHRGGSHPMRPHGFAPASRFAVTSAEPTRCRLSLEANEETRRSYPFEFRLDIDLSLDGARLDILATVTALGDEAMPWSLGLHPGFAWPLPGCADLPREAHVVAFDADETPLIRRTSAEGLLPEPDTIPLRDRRLPLDEALFARDAVIFDRLASRAIWYGVPGRPGIRVDLGDMPHLGLWSRAPGRFLCLEPWQGLPDPKGYTGELADKPGIVLTEPGGRSTRRVAFTFGAPGPDGV